MQRAIQEAASALLSLPLSDKNFLPVKKALIGEQDRYVNNYKIAAENQEEGNYFVVVNVSVALLDLKNDLAKLGFRQTSGEEKTNIIICLEVKRLKQYSDFLYLNEFLKNQSKMVKNICSRSLNGSRFVWSWKFQVRRKHWPLSWPKQAGPYWIPKQVKKNQIVISLLQEGGE